MADPMKKLEEGERLLADMTPMARVAKSPAASRDAVIEEMRTAWLCGPNSVDDEYMHVLGEESDGESVSICLTGNGPKRRINAHAIVWLINNAPALLAGMRALAEIASNEPLDIDPRIRYLEVQVQREEWQAARDALAAFTKETDQ